MPRPHRRTRARVVLTLIALACPALLAGCGGEAGGAVLAAGTPLPTAVPPGTRIVVGDPQTRKALELSGELGKLIAEVEFANISGGPQTTEAFRAKALDVGAVAEIPPIHATWTGLEVRIVATRFRRDPLNHPIYQLGIAPGVQVTSLEDLRGKRIAYSPGQAQGALVLRSLRQAGLTKEDVKLVELPSTGDIYPNALAARQVEVAPLGGVQVRRYLAKYGGDGGTTIEHGQRDDAAHLYVVRSSLENPAKAAAIREYVAAWARAQVWIDRHPEEWIEGYYVKDQGLSAADGRWLVDNAGRADIPADWGGAIARHQETIDLLAEETGNPPLRAADLYDQRFAPVAAQASGSGARP